MESGADDRGELIGWALSAMPERLAARRVKIDYLLEGGHFDSADALIARSLICGRPRESGALMRLRFARSLHAQGRLESADHEIRRVLDERPHDCRALVLAARIAGARHNHVRAVELMVLACDVRPADASLRAELVEALLAADLTDHAARELRRIASPSAVLVARVLRAEHRLLEAVEVIERAARDVTSAPPSAVLMELIEALEELGDGARLSAALEHAPAEPAVQIRAVKAMLALGQPQRVEGAIAALGKDPRFRREAIPVLLAVRTMAGEFEQSQSALDQLDALPCGPDRAATASVWLSAMAGALLRSAIDARAAGRDPDANMLTPMLQRAAAVLRSALSNSDAETDRSQHRNHLAMCIEATGEAISTTSAALLVMHEQMTGGDGHSVTDPMRRAA
jgi:hypothetical protein